MRLLLVRHAESLGNREGRLQGRCEFSLTERGQRQAEALALRLAAMSMAALYASPLLRVRETAEPLAAQAGLAIRLEPRVQEYDFGGAISGLTWREIRGQRPEIVETLRGGGPDFPSYPGGEDRGPFQERVCQALWEIVARHEADEAVAVVTHGGPIAVFLMNTMNRPYRHPVPFTIDNSSLTTIEMNSRGQYGSAGAVVVGLNDTCHLGSDDGR